LPPAKKLEKTKQTKSLRLSSLALLQTTIATWKWKVLQKAMITPREIRQKAERLYPTFVKNWIAGEDIFPKRIRANLTPPADHLSAKRAVDELRQASKAQRGYGYEVTWEQRRSRTHGQNEFPTQLNFDTREDFLKFIKKQSEFESLDRCVRRIRELEPELTGWLVQSMNWKQVIEVANDLDDLLLMTRYLVDHPRPDMFAREIPLAVSTKLIEENNKLLAAWLDLLLPDHQIDFQFGRDEFDARYGLRYPRPHLLLRLLDDELLDETGLPFEELSLPADSINRLPIKNVTVLVVENKVNLLTLPPIPRGVAIGGLGKAISLVRNINWLEDATIYYWGDLDVEGFEMLCQFREICPHTESLMMNLETFRKFEHLAIDWPNQSRFTPSVLLDSEQLAFQFVRENRKRLEQERIPQSFVNTQISQLATHSK
jgi:hypothetical protein